MDCEKIVMPNKQAYGWDSINKLQGGTEETISIEISKDKIIVRLEKIGRKLTSRVIRQYNIDLKEYELKIFIDEVTDEKRTFDENHGGLLGIASRKRYQSHQPLNYDENKSLLMSIEGRKVTSFVKSKPHSIYPCFSLNIDDILYPENVTIIKSNQILN